MNPEASDAASGTASFALARMSPLLLGLSCLLLALPAVFAIVALRWAPWLLIVTALLVLAYGWVWLRFRPTRFVVRADGLSIVWPLRLKWIPPEQIRAARVISRTELRAEVGRGIRVGAGGLWGGFGRLWTQKRGSLHLYVSRLDRFVWIDCNDDEPWLITPERPEEFVRALEAMRAGRPGSA